MKRILFILIILSLSVIDNSFALINVTGALDRSNKIFYFTGSDRYFWSNYYEKFVNDSNKAYKYDLGKRDLSLFYSDQCDINNLQLSPNSELISFICSNSDRSLLILNIKGALVLKLSEPIQEYIWHPNNSDILFITGERKQSYERKFTSTGVWLYNIEKRTRKKIANSGWDIRNMSFDKHIYYWDGDRTVRYNINTNTIEGTDKKEKVNYSPNKKYYIYFESAEDPKAWDAPYWSPFRMFNVLENKDMSSHEIGFVSERNPIGPIWNADSKRIAFKGNVSRTNYDQLIYIYDIESNQVIKKIKGEIAGYDNERKVLVIYRDGEFFLENF